ncbi:MAG TPA: radical SAM protein [Acidisarcina sp.]
MGKVILVNPSMATLGYSIVTPRWMFVIAQATPHDLVGTPVLVDETIKAFDSSIISPGDIVGIGIITGNCTAGYRVLAEAKRKGATVIVGGIHATIFPSEPLEMGADAVVTGNGDVVWGRAIKDAFSGQLQRRYDGGRLPGELLLKARWDLLDRRNYLMPTVQTIAGCPERCDFCSVWVTEGRQPRPRVAAKIIEEVNQLYEKGYRLIIFADDNFNPATLGRIAREQSSQKRRQLEQVREERLALFEEYDRSVPKDIYGLTQMTTEVTSDPEYLSAMHEKMRIRGALIGVESFTQEGLENVGKEWNPVGENMVTTIQTIQSNGILVLSTIICGLESDTVESVRRMNAFALRSGTALAQFTYYDVYPGTKDFYEMMNDNKNAAEPGFVRKHKTELLRDRFWLEPTTVRRAQIVRYANIAVADLVRETTKCWQSFYSIPEALKRVRRGGMGQWPVVMKLTYIGFCLAFYRLYSGRGMAADSVRQKEMGTVEAIPYQIMPNVVMKVFVSALVRMACRPTKKDRAGRRDGKLLRRPEEISARSSSV